MTLDDLIALCDEMAALARAGVPLDRGLRDIARDLPGKLGRTTGKIAAGLEQGQDLGAYLRAHADEFPPAFTAVVEAGLRVGRLPAALEDLAQSARKLSLFKRSLLAAWLYPLIVVIVGFNLLLFMFLKPIPVMLKAFNDVAVSDNPLMRLVAALRDSIDWWGPLVPAVFLIYLLWAWWRAQQADLSGSSLRWWSLGLAGPLLRLKRATQLATFTNLLTLLVEHLVPLPEALRLAGQSSHDRGLAQAAERLAVQLQRGESPQGIAGLPPVLSWLLCHPPAGGELAPALRLLADGYGEEVQRQADMLNWYGPVVLTALVAGSVTAVYCALVAGPWISVLYAYLEAALA